jgi:HD-GYP domain-containing protein (c-di-GMP phosphodiesterase class II)
MSFEPTIEEQERLAETLRRQRTPMTGRERGAEWTVGGAFAVAVALMCWLRPPGAFAVGPALLCMAVMALACNVRFDTPLGFTVATQLAFVPLLFVLPVALVAPAVVVVLVCAQLPARRTGELSARGLWMSVGNAWFAVGPAAVFAIADVSPLKAGPTLLLGALAAQFTLDFAVSTVRFTISRGASLGSQLRELWVYAIDAALSPVPLLISRDVHSTLGVLALVPMLGLLATFAHERQRRLQHLLELNSAYRGTALVLGDVVEADDRYTGEHSRDVVMLALAVGDRLKLNVERRRNLEFAALLHDVGKVAIPKDIINKPGKLDAEEWALMKTHTILGQKMLDRVGGFMSAVGAIVRSHHERWDGDGYPDALAGEDIALEARIISGCDTWNAMRTDRSYRKALPLETALRELRDIAGSQLDPRVVAALIAEVAPDQAAGDDAGAPVPPAVELAAAA